MKEIVHNPADLGHVAEQNRIDLGLRQSDIHALTKLNPRFIGEVERGKETAQIGKVMTLLESIGLEFIIRQKTNAAKINPHTLGLSKGRFWSSGEQLPVIRVIARVLADPIESDLKILKNNFGMSSILATWKQLKDRGEVAQSVIPITTKMLRKLASSQ